jgi:hypothetical protein
MLLHNCYVNLAFAVILSLKRSPYDLQKLRLKKSPIAPGLVLPIQIAHQDDSSPEWPNKGPYKPIWYTFVGREKHTQLHAATTVVI